MRPITSTAIFERTRPNGILVMTETGETFDVVDPAHTSSARDIERAALAAGAGGIRIIIYISDLNDISVLQFYPDWRANLCRSRASSGQHFARSRGHAWGYAFDQPARECHRISRTRASHLCHSGPSSTAAKPHCFHAPLDTDR